MKKKWFLAQIFLTVGLLTGCGLPSATYESKETTEEAIEEEGFGWENLQEETLNQEETKTTDLSQNTMAEIKEFSNASMAAPIRKMITSCWKICVM